MVPSARLCWFSRQWGSALGHLQCLHQQLYWYNCGVENWDSEGERFLEQNSGLMPNFTLKGLLET